MAQRASLFPIIVAGGLALTGAQGHAADAASPPDVTTLLSQSFAGVALRVDDFVGTLNIEVGAGPMEVVITGSEAMIKDLGVRLESDILVIKRFGMVVQKQPFVATRYPTVTVRVPDATPVTIDDMDGIAVIGDLHAPLMVFGASLDLQAGDVSVVSIDRSGSGDIVLGRIAGALTARLAGSGDLTVAAAGSVDVEKRGSGTVTLGPVAGGIIARLSGSGDFSAAAASTTRIDKRGSGDVRLGPIQGGLTFKSSGIGDVDVASVNGPVVVETASSGKIHIHAGRAEPLAVALSEYGDFTLDGLAVDPAIAVSGASVIKLQSYIGTFAPSGTGDNRVGGNRIYPLADNSRGRKRPRFDPQEASRIVPSDSQL